MSFDSLQESLYPYLGSIGLFFLIGFVILMWFTTWPRWIKIAITTLIFGLFAIPALFLGLALRNL
jgi:hypothetical protein